MKPVFLASILGLSLASLPAMAEDISFVSKVWSQVVMFEAPDRFAPAFRSQQGSHFLIELVPKDQSVEKWTEMITLTGHRGDTGTAGAFAANLMALYERACPETFASAALPPPEVEGARAVAASFVGCGDLGGYSESMVFVAIDGAKDVYTLQWAERGKAVAGPPRPDMDQWMARLKQFRTASFISD